MAQKRSTPLDDPPSASSDDDETEEEQEIIAQKNEESSSSEEDEEESDEESGNPVKNPVEKPKIENPSSRTEESSSEEEFETESEEEEATPVIASVEKSKTLNPKSPSISKSEPDIRSPTASGFAIRPSKKINFLETPEKTPTSKRTFPESDVNDRKKSKVSDGDIEDEKKSAIKRVWSDDDELSLLQGFIDYQSAKGCSPLSDIDGFYRFIMGSLPGNASKNQMYDKIRRLKKKYRVNSEKASGDGDDPVFSKPHEYKLFELSKKIWGIGGIESVSGGLTAKSKARPKIEVKEEDEGDEMRAKPVAFDKLYPHWVAGLSSEGPSSLSFPKGIVTLIKKDLSLIGAAKAKEMDEKWKAHFENESMLRIKRASLLGKIADMVTPSLG